MESKTPKFDALLDKILDELASHERECLQKDISPYCEKKFSLEREDIEFLKLLRVPPPKCCPTCRRQRRFAFVNRVNLYKRENDSPLSKGDVLSFVPPASSLVVYDLDYYRSAAWDPLVFASEYDSDRPFFSQLLDLRLKVPQYAIIRDSSSVNSEYSINGRNLKNGYLVSGGFNSENIWYSIYLGDSREIMDSQDVKNCERCFDVILAKNLNLCAFCYFSKDCINSRFLYDCRNCQDCFGCVNLHNKKYCYFNKQLSKEEYENTIEAAGLDRRSNLEIMKRRFWNFVKTEPLRASRCVQAVNSSGALIIDSKDCQNALSCELCEHERYVDMVIDHRDSMDVYSSGKSELLYEVSGVGSDAANVKFSFGSKFVTDSEFLVNCHKCQYCFACIGLENKSYCIFNKVYPKEEYFQELDRIKSSLLEKGEYGEFFPYRISTFAYNGSEADYSFPLEEKNITKLDALYQPDIDIDTSGLDVIKAKDIPDSLDDVSDDILDKALICEVSGRPFRIIGSELEFYRKMRLPLPSMHPLLRMKNTFSYLGNNRIYKDTCRKCMTGLETIYNPSEHWNVYCDKCYQKEVY